MVLSCDTYFNGGERAVDRGSLSGRRDGVVGRSPAFGSASKTLVIRGPGFESPRRLWLYVSTIARSAGNSSPLFCCPAERIDDMRQRTGCETGSWLDPRHHPASSQHPSYEAGRHAGTAGHSDPTQIPSDVRFEGSFQVPPVASPGSPRPDDFELIRHRARTTCCRRRAPRPRASRYRLSRAAHMSPSPVVKASFAHATRVRRRPGDPRMPQRGFGANRREAR